LTIFFGRGMKTTHRVNPYWQAKVLQRNNTRLRVNPNDQIDPYWTIVMHLMHLWANQ